MKAAVNSQRFGSGNHLRNGISIAALAVLWSAPAFAQGETAAEVVADQTGPSAAEDQPPAASQATPEPTEPGDRVVVTARRVEEDVQDVPIPVAVLSEEFLADTGAFNAGKISSLVPSVQFYSTNPRNSAINIRGIGSPFGLTNDGIEQGVGLYVDGVYYAPARRRRDGLHGRGPVLLGRPARRHALQHGVRGQPQRPKQYRRPPGTFGICLEHGGGVMPEARRTPIKATLSYPTGTKSRRQRRTKSRRRSPAS